MAELVPDDVLEKIMIGFDVKDLIRCKCVCKSWQSFVTSSRFVKAQLNYSYNNDRNLLGHRRIFIRYKVASGPSCYHGFDNSLLGSSNGLVCISTSRDQVLVANPSTREVKKLQNPVIPDFINWSSLYWGFGYDKSTDDYKVIVGFEEGKNRIHFQVLNLKLNVWKVIGDVNYSCIRMARAGSLYNGALHWLMHDQNDKKVIVSFDLCQEKFTEIPMPGVDLGYEYPAIYILGIFNERLCMICLPNGNHGWVMKNYNGKKSWRLLPYVSGKYKDVVHYFQIPDNYILHDCIFESTSWDCIRYPIFVQSLVSPHMQRQIKIDATI